MGATAGRHLFPRDEVVVEMRMAEPDTCTHQGCLSPAGRMGFFYDQRHSSRGMRDSFIQ
jgi:hypothetical protein